MPRLACGCTQVRHAEKNAASSSHSPRACWGQKLQPASSSYTRLQHGCACGAQYVEHRLGAGLATQRGDALHLQITLNCKEAENTGGRGIEIYGLAVRPSMVMPCTSRSLSTAEGETHKTCSVRGL